jgi:hypothetical protein
MDEQGALGPDDAASAAARARAAAILDQAARVQLDVVVIARPDAIRTAAREEGRAAAGAAGRTALLDEAVAAARDRISRTFAIGGFSGTWAATDMAVSVTRVDDRVAAAAALEEAVTGAVVADLVDPETAQVLGASWAELSGLREIPAPGSLANLGASITRRLGRSEPPPSE